MDHSIAAVPPSGFSWDDQTGTAAELRDLVALATRADGRSPLNEQSLLSLRHDGLSSAALWVARDGDTVTGFALANARPGAAEAEVEMAVAPSARGRGTGTALARAVLEEFAGAAVSAWSHGNHPAAAALAARTGLARVRDLWVMRRPLTDPLPEARAADGVVVRTFEPGRDEQAVLEVNAAAFAHHPEQGGMTREDLDQRVAEPWFDPAGFFLAERPAGAEDAEDPQLLGFHWTKVHAVDPPYGEVYVVGIAPEAQGMGLGKVLTLAGLHHLASRGLGEVILYVEADNAPAVAVYRALGFTHADSDTDVMYARGRD